MKTLNLIKSGIILFALAGIVVTGCKKDTTTTNNDQATALQTAQDQSNVQAAEDQHLNDASTAMGQTKGMMLASAHTTITDTIIGSTETITITYNGNDDASRFSRTGTLTIVKTVGEKWNTPGTSVQITYTNIKVTKIKNGDYMILNGTKTFTHVSGVPLVDAAVVHQISGTLSIQFSDGTSRNWTVTRQRTYTGNPLTGQMTVTETGFGGTDNTIFTGTNRKGDEFTTRVIVPIVANQSDHFFPSAGVIVHTVPAEGIIDTITYGLDDNDLKAPGHFKIAWCKNGKKQGNMHIAEK